VRADSTVDSRREPGRRFCTAISGRRFCSAARSTPRSFDRGDSRRTCGGIEARVADMEDVRSFVDVTKRRAITYREQDADRETERDAVIDSPLRDLLGRHVAKDLALSVQARLCGARPRARCRSRRLTARKRNDKSTLQGEEIARDDGPSARPLTYGVGGCARKRERRGSRGDDRGARSGGSGSVREHTRAAAPGRSRPSTYCIATVTARRSRCRASNTWPRCSV